MAAFGEALTAVHDLGDPIGEAYALHGLGLAHLRGGDFTEAGTALASAQPLAISNGGTAGRGADRVQPRRAGAGLRASSRS